MKDSNVGTVLLGAHMSIAGGVHTAIERAVRIGCTTLQMFVKNNNQWKGKALSDEDVATYKDALSKARIGPVVVHDTYLINLCASDRSILKKSRDALTDELQRCEKLGVDYLNFHPGAHMGRGEKEGIERIAESLNMIHTRTKGFRVKSVIESTAGQGTALGYKFEQLKDMIDLVDEQERMAVCIDTCHIFAAGYDIVSEEGYHRTFREFDDIIGLDRLVAFHVNDSKRELGSRVDRHEHIGKGKIGLEGFRLIMNDERFVNIPKILETPKSDDMHEDVENMAVLKGLIGT
ncbi:MAG: deoxyribonuclease IV [Ignavibacteria bacterium GWA2_55_11]|nr:MAG: deoxyribonuclease IV [Ignavibacteria bacterium GWA2_55_11]OGU69546.1 MAG: deoxyribonuclease IV [Ignavibacteria bacterium RIFCSPLOWO2_02_FULL_55_14]